MTQWVYKAIAAFLILTMVFSALVSFYWGGPAEQEREQEEFNTFNIGGKLVEHDFNSISDALKMTPPGITQATFIDFEAMQGTLLEQWTREVYTKEVDKLYQSNTTKMYFTYLNNTPLLLTTIYPRKIAFEYTVLPYHPYQDYYFLIRADTGAINVMGDPIIYGSYENAIKVIDILEGYANNTAYDQFSSLLNVATPPGNVSSYDQTEGVPFQRISAKTDFADQFYDGIKEKDGHYERTRIYLNASKNLTTRIGELKSNSSERGFKEYNVTQDKNITIVRIISDLAAVLGEEYD